MENKKFKFEIANNIITAEPLPNFVVDQYGMGHAIFKAMKRYSNRTAQVDPISGQSQSYRDLLSRCVRTAIELQNRGIGRGDIVTLCSNNHMDACVPFFASLFLGARIASLDPTISLDDTEHLLKQVRPNIIFHSDNARKLITSLLPKCDLHIDIVDFSTEEFEEFVEKKDGENDFEPVLIDDNTETAIIFFSSGTTGLPKGIELSHYSLLMQSSILHVYGFDGTVVMGFASLYWISAVLFTLASVFLGFNRIVCKIYTPNIFWNTINDYKVTFSFLSPSAGIGILKQGRPENVDSTHLLDLLVGGGPMSTENLMALRDLFPGTNVHLGYGQTEVGGASIVFKPACREDVMLMHLKGNSSGRPSAGVSYKIVDPETEEVLGPNEPGELRLKTSTVMNGYFGIDSSDAWDSDGWLRTGDVVYYDDDACFYVVDRIKEMLKFQSWHVAPAKLEGLLLTHSDVKDVCVIGKPDDEDGDHPMAIVVRVEGSDVTETDLVQFVEERVEDKQRLRGGVTFVDSFPYTPSGKIKRKLLKTMILEGNI